MIFIIDDDEIMAECVAGYCGNKEVKIFSNGIEAMAAIDDELPELIFLDIMLDGPNGFTFLNELVSYDDTANIPIIIMSSLNLKDINLEDYNVKGILNKDTMTPREVKQYVNEFCA